MARVTVEDCLEHVDNRFELVMRATRRARQIHRGADPLLMREDDKETVIALREIADGVITDEVLEAADEVVEEPELEIPFHSDLDDPADDF